MYTLGSVYVEKIKKREKWNIDTVERRNISRTVTNEENDTQTVQDLDYGEKQWKCKKM